MEAKQNSTEGKSTDCLFQDADGVYLAYSHPERHHAAFAALTKDVALGIETILAIAEVDQIADACEDSDGNPEPKLLNGYRHGALLRLARASLSMLADSAEKHVEFVRQQTH